MKNRYLVLRADGGIDEIVTPGIGKLNDFQKAVGGLIEGIVVTFNGVDYEAYCNEEGRIVEPPLPSNKFFPEICGDILLAHTDSEGNSLGVTDDEYNSVLKLRGV